MQQLSFHWEKASLFHVATVVQIRTQMVIWVPQPYHEIAVHDAFHAKPRYYTEFIWFFPPKHDCYIYDIVDTITVVEEQ